MKIQDFLFCEDVRNEVHGKLSLIGLYNDRISISFANDKNIRWPIPLTLALVLRFHLDHQDERPDAFEFEYFMNEKSLMKIPGQVTVPTKEQEGFNLTLKGLGIPVELGHLGFKITLYKNKKVLFSRSFENAIKIVRGEDFQNIKIASSNNTKS